MHPLHDFIANLLSKKIRDRRVAVLYDPRRELTPFFRELETSSPKYRLFEYDGSFFGLRAQVEPFVAADLPEPLLIYVPGVERDPKESVLLELELAGVALSSKLKSWTRYALREKYTDVTIDDMLSRDGVTYQDLARFASRAAGSDPPSMLRLIFPKHRDPDSLIAAFLASDSADAEIEAKSAVEELSRLCTARLGFDSTATLPQAPLLAALVRARRRVPQRPEVRPSRRSGGHSRARQQGPRQGRPRRRPAVAQLSRRALFGSRGQGRAGPEARLCRDRSVAARLD